MATKEPLAFELETQTVLEWYAKGWGSTRIAKELGRPHEWVQQRIRAAAERVRDENREFVEAAFMQQALQLERLYELCSDAIEKAAKDDRFDEKAVKCAILLMDRRARLLGLDTVKVQGTRDLYSWLDQASQSDLVRMAEKHGIRLPEKFTFHDA